MAKFFYSWRNTWGHRENCLLSLLWHVNLAYLSRVKCWVATEFWWSAQDLCLLFHWGEQNFPQNQLLRVWVGAVWVWVSCLEYFVNKHITQLLSIKCLFLHLPSALSHFHLQRTLDVCILIAFYSKILFMSLNS